MRKALALIIVLAAALAMAQTTTVTLQVTDTPDSQSWNNGTYSVNLVIPSSFSGTQPTPQLVSGALNATGGASFVLASNAPIAGSYWRFSVCPQATADCYRQSVTVSGATQTVTLNPPSIRINASNAPPSLTAYTTTEIVNPALGAQFFNLTSLTEQQWNGTAWTSIGGGGSSPNQPAFLVTSAPYNAKCDGSTNDLTAIQAAINAAAATGNGGTVIFPVGQCNILGTLTITTNNIVLIGQGPRLTGTGNGTTIMETSASADIIDITGSNSSFPSSYLQSVYVRELTIDRNISPTTSSNGIRLQYCVGCKIQDVESWNSVNNFFQVNVNNMWYERTWAIAGTTSGASADATGYNISGVANSTWMYDTNAAGNSGGTLGTGILLGSGSVTVDLNSVRFETNSQVKVGISIAGAVEDVHFMNPILDACITNCILINSSSAGDFGLPNGAFFVSCHCIGGSSATSGATVMVSSSVASSGFSFIGGQYSCNQSTTGACNAILLNTGSSFNIIQGVQFFSVSGTNTSAPIGLVGATDNIVTGNTVTAVTGHPMLVGIALTSSSVRNTVTGNLVNGFATEGILADSTSSGNVFTGNIVDTANIATAVLDQSGGNTYTSSTLAPGIIGDAFSYKSTATITGPVPVKLDTANANQVVQTVTTDTGAGIPVGVCANSPAAGNACLVMTHGTVALKMGTSLPCAIGNFAIVDTTTNGDFKCVAAYTAGTVIGVSQAANSTVGSASNVMIGLR